MRFIPLCSIFSLLALAGCGYSAPDYRTDWSNINYAYINCPPGSDGAGCSAGEDSLAAIGRSKGK